MKKNIVIKTIIPLVFKGFNVPQDGYVFKHNNKLTFSSGWNINDNLYCYSYDNNKGKYIGEWINFEDLPIRLINLIEKEV